MIDQLPNLGLLLTLWVLAAGGAVFAVALTWRISRRETDLAVREQRLPAACEHQDLEARIGLQREKLEELSEQSKAAADVVARRDQAVAELEQVQARAEQTRQELLVMEGERQRQEALRLELQSLERSLETSHEELRKALADKARATAEAEAQQASTARQRQEVADLTERSGELRQALDTLVLEVNRSRTESEQAALALQRLRQELASVMERKRAEEDALRACEADRREAESTIEELTKRQEGLVRRLGDYEDEHRAAAEKLAALHQEHELAGRELADVQASLRQTTTRQTEAAEQLRRTLATADEVREERQRLAIEVAELEAALAGLRTERDALSDTIATLRKLAEGQERALERAGSGPAESRYRDLWEPLPLVQLRPTRAPRGEREALTQTAKYLRDSGLVFPERVLNAFHTALKVNEISPLVVLAGISGTGKSELPRRYAEGMGMHFVGLAVQPRWDSPQDIFGFYNYLEKRYKATELARALVQFERHNRRAWPLPDGWNHGLEDQMLLVLLDEMNLARVEYYFSEFLSKLETRRGIDRTNRADRAKAEIVIEMGALAKEENPMRVFADGNVLFTGTMNEDESTQSLSDKVLDRASVLRFGRPRDLAPRMGDPNAQACGDALSYANWQGWLRSAERSGHSTAQVNSWLEGMNEAMDALDRPFGHRVAQAIQSYVANYPSWVQNGTQLAMADQIEQRILPRLRGIDVEDARASMRKIEAIIEDLEDGPLLRAFRAGQQSPTFLWRGIDRSEG